MRFELGDIERAGLLRDKGPIAGHCYVCPGGIDA
jgi:hypothetical protein